VTPDQLLIARRIGAPTMICGPHSIGCRERDSRWYRPTSPTRGWRDGGTRQIERHTRPVRSVDGDVRLNRALWTLADEMAKIKALA